MFLLHNRILLPFYYGYTNLLLDSFYIYNSLLTETLKESDTAQVFSEGKKKKKLTLMLSAQAPAFF